MKHKILLVDDDVDLINLYQPVLQNAGFQVDVAFNAEEGLKKFQEFKPEAMLVDLAMEHFDSGFVLCQKVKNTQEGRNIPVIIMTAAGHETGIRFSTQTEEEKNWIKADDYLDKPISAQDLLQYVTEKLFKNK
ncbi:response regulator transcription factor [candidate division KSB1 bacterium]|nr:response regulator transcription factor [candidate division KSB1 bacterium]